MAISTCSGRGMTKEEFIKEYKNLIELTLQQPTSEGAWLKLARHIDGRILNYEESLVSTKSLEDLDTKKLVPWREYIWAHVHKLFPKNIEALEMLSEYYLEVIDDVESAVLVVEKLRKIAPKNALGLHYEVLLASVEEDDNKAQDSLLKLCEIDAKTAVFRGTFDFVGEDLTFLTPVAAKIQAAIDSTEPSGYIKSLRTQISKLISNN